ncbi:hypothetical protein R1sor_017220 [Riccia sorocarpa]|uniref:Zinc knuckle CX2CX4HX4C domain-containing protein n=1 Tax=Riccia sorocarpa TaxID=122646 RepID=A0ABD3I661_9MARC
MQTVGTVLYKELVDNERGSVKLRVVVGTEIEEFPTTLEVPITTDFTIYVQLDYEGLHLRCYKYGSLDHKAEECDGGQNQRQRRSRANEPGQNGGEFGISLNIGGPRDSAVRRDREQSTTEGEGKDYQISRRRSSRRPEPVKIDNDKQIEALKNIKEPGGSKAASPSVSTDTRSESADEQQGGDRVLK